MILYINLNNPGAYWVITKCIASPRGLTEPYPAGGNHSCSMTWHLELTVRMCGQLNVNSYDEYVDHAISSGFAVMQYDIAESKPLIGLHWASTRFC